MIDAISGARKVMAASFTMLGLLAVAACEPVTTAGLGEGPSIEAGAQVPVALLVPAGSGEAGDASLAGSLENAARLAVADLNGADIDLRVYDTGGRPGPAADAARRAVAEGARILLGPLYAQSANAAGVAVSEQAVNVLSFSNNPAIAGGNVFILGPTFANTADRLVDYAVGRGIDDIMVIHAETSAERVGRDAIVAAVRESGAQLAGTASFALSQQALTEAAPGIARQTREANADAVFLTSTSDGALPFVARALPDNGLGPDRVQYLGLGRWDRPPQTLTLPGLQGGWFARPPQGRMAEFRRRYRARYGRAPLPVASLAYDGVAAIGALVASGRADALTRGALTQPSGFAGAGGDFRLLPDGTNERALAVAEVRDNQVTIIDPAPRRFGGAGS